MKTCSVADLNKQLIKYDNVSDLESANNVTLLQLYPTCIALIACCALPRIVPSIIYLWVIIRRTASCFWARCGLLASLLWEYCPSATMCIVKMCVVYTESTTLNIYALGMHLLRQSFEDEDAPRRTIFALPSLNRLTFIVAWMRFVARLHSSCFSVEHAWNLVSKDLFYFISFNLSWLFTMHKSHVFWLIGIGRGSFHSVCLPNNYTGTFQHGGHTHLIRYSLCSFRLLLSNFDSVRKY